MRRSQNGLTIIELLIVATIIGILGVFGFALVGDSSIFTSPEQAAREHIMKLYPGVYAEDIGVACKKWDTNGDSNRRCDVRFTHPRTELELVRNLECDYFGQCAEMRQGYRW